MSTQPLHANRVPTDRPNPTGLRMVPVETLRTRGARHLLGTWRTSRTDHVPPGEGAMAPSSFGDLAGNLYRLDVDALSQRMRFRFVGEQVGGWFGEDLGGRFLDEIATLPDRDQHDEDCRLAIRERRPVAAVVRGVMSDDGRPVTLELLILPLTHGLRAADGVICGVFAREETAREDTACEDTAGPAVGTPAGTA